MKLIEFEGTTISVDVSPGIDGAIVVYIDTYYEPDGSDGTSGMRIYLNEDCLYESTPFLGPDEDIMDPEENYI